jgi:3-deoxy-D-manno-octulosonic-acid transferase
MWLVYYSCVYLYVGLIRLASIKSTKAKFWLEGRYNWKRKLENKIPTDRPKIWLHCASLGEFEQGRPILEKLKVEYPTYFIVLTFFSPSGYEIRKNYAHADLILYLPADTLGNANYFISKVNPALVIIVKYEFWMGYLAQIKKRKIPSTLISARFRKNQLFFGIVGAWFRSYLKAFSTIHVQDKASKSLLNKYGFEKVIESGDTRFDRVAENANQPKVLPEIEKWLLNRQAIIVGSSWSSDEEIIFPWNFSEYVLIIAPHEIDESHIRAIEFKCEGKSIRYTDLLEGKTSENSRVLIINTIGLLMSIYHLGKIAFVGGAFKGTLHNILEPAAIGLPVIFGPKTNKFPEGDELIQAKGGFKIHTRDQLIETIQYLSINENAASHGQQSLEYVNKHIGATKLIMKDIGNLLKDKSV